MQRSQDVYEAEPAIQVLEEIRSHEEGYIRELNDQIIYYVNIEREKAGLLPLEPFEKAGSVAEYKVLEMAELNYFAHESPRYGDITNQFSTFGGIVLQKKRPDDRGKPGDDHREAQGEDIRTRNSGILDGSEGHRENILNSEYDKTGAAVYFSDDGSCYAAQEFCMMIE